MPFDPKKPKGTVTPVTNGAMYWQGGKHYDHEYNEVDFATGKILAHHKQPTPPKKEVGPDPLPPPRKTMPSNITSEGEVSQGSGDELVGWAKGEKAVQFFRIRQLVAEKHGVTVANAKEARKLILGG